MRLSAFICVFWAVFASFSEGLDYCCCGCPSPCEVVVPTRCPPPTTSCRGLLRELSRVCPAGISKNADDAVFVPIGKDSWRRPPISRNETIGRESSLSKTILSEKVIVENGEPVTVTVRKTPSGIQVFKAPGEPVSPPSLHGSDNGNQGLTLNEMLTGIQKSFTSPQGGPFQQNIVGGVGEMTTGILENVMRFLVGYNSETVF
ncbi:unnamed protein product [Caenorhabditis auriculariae]|uniref:Uncharacterized protein n=1 Tax=Caenorhabditis auriculariae TaxID=2777116 RepID=A0A8S1HJI8_9PELO|nr:unnamed protein product [Caenorhabditis auriculariae]